MSRRKCTARAKLKATSQEEQIYPWKQHFDNLLGKLSKVTDEPTMKIISNQLDIKLDQFRQEELNFLLRKIKNRKAAGLDKYRQKYRRQGNSTRFCSDTATPNITRTIDRWTKGCIHPFPKKGDLRTAKIC